MNDRETDFEDDSFDEDWEPFPDSFALSIASEWPLHCDGLLSGNSITDRTWIFTPKLLKKLVAQVIINSSGKYRLQNREIPHHLYPLLFGEAARMKKDESIWYLISTWPYTVLNFNELEMPLDSHMGFFTRVKQDKSPALSESIIRGLFYRSRMKCRLKMVILPKDVSEAAEIMKTFIQIPIHYLRDLPDVNIDEILRNSQYSEGEKYLKTVPKLDLKRPISYAAYRKDKLRLVIVLPSVVVHFLGARQNYDDVIVGLILQRHSPFLFHFDNLAVCNFPLTKYIGAILDRLVNPEGLRKLILHNKYFYKPEHVAVIIRQLSPVLQRLTGLKGFYTKLTSVLGVSQPKGHDLHADLTYSLAATIRKWTSLEKLSLCEQSLSGYLDAILLPIPTSLVKLSLVAARLQSNDFVALGRSQHARTIRTLQLDHNDLHSCLPAVHALLLNLPRLFVLQTRHCLLSFDDCMALAVTLRASTTIRSWTVINNHLLSLTDLKAFLVGCSKVMTLKEVGCRPAEYQYIFGQLLMNNRFQLTEDEKEILARYSDDLGLDLV